MAIKRLLANIFHSYENLRRLFSYALFVSIAHAQNCEVDRSVRINGLPYLRSPGICHFGANVIISSSLSANPIGGQPKTIIVVGPAGRLVIDDGARISNSTIFATKDIYIGKNVFIGAGCKIYDTDFHSLRLKERLQNNDPGIISEPVFISDGAFIGGHSIILKGVSIGEEAIVGAGSVVTKDIPSLQVWGGNPAKFIRCIAD